MTRHVLVAFVAFAALPATAVADEPVVSVSVDVEVSSTVTTAIAEEPEAPVCELTMGLDQRPLRWRKGIPMLATGRTYRFAGRLLCDGAPVPAGTVVEAGDAGTFAVGSRGRIVARVAYHGARAITFSAHGATVRIAVRPR